MTVWLSWSMRNLIFSDKKWIKTCSVTKQSVLIATKRSWLTAGKTQKGQNKVSSIHIKFSKKKVINCFFNRLSDFNWLSFCHPLSPCSVSTMRWARTISRPLSSSHHYFVLLWFPLGSAPDRALNLYPLANPDSFTYMQIWGTCIHPLLLAKFSLKLWCMLSSIIHHH